MKKLGQALFLTLLATAACAEEYPEEPTWNGEIELMLTANCVRCHGETSPSSHFDFRLDVYEHAVGRADAIRDRAIEYEENGMDQMPPDSYLTNDQKDALERWLDNGMPRGD